MHKAIDATIIINITIIKLGFDTSFKDLSDF